ncbi:trypsin-like peptidase domain-containing protein [Fusobacterium sp. MFO224]|uniref:trypsin-like peptidase domain-containing protein n=1 Tax=Fusobacterium sp. MFO224 TaxID=3378070 RepID=UPI003854385B
MLKKIVGKINGGTCFLVNKNYILTVSHCVEENDIGEIIEISFPNLELTLKAKLLEKLEVPLDFAVLKLEEEVLGVDFIPLFNDILLDGEKVISYGFPVGHPVHGRKIYGKIIDSTLIMPKKDLGIENYDLKVLSQDIGNCSKIFIEGHSGSPLLVNNKIVGIIKNSLGDGVGVQKISNFIELLDKYKIIHEEVKDEKIRKKEKEIGPEKLKKIKELQGQSLRRLKEINYKLIYRDNEICLERKALKKEVQKIILDSSITLVVGEGGVGKSAIVKSFFNKLESNYSSYLFNGSQFNINSISEILEGLNIYDFINFNTIYDNNYLVIDSAERLINIENKEPIKELMNELIQNDWRIIFTIRENEEEKLKEILKNFKNLKRVEVSNLNKNELDKIIKKYKLNIPKNKKVKKALHNLFYLSRFLLSYDISKEALSFESFKEILWKEMIYTPIKEQEFLSWIHEKVNENRYYKEFIDSNDTFQELESRGIVKYDSKGYYLAHDIYEDWALEKIIEKEFCNKSNNNNFFVKIGENYLMKRAFRNWLKEKLDINDRDSIRLVEWIIEESALKEWLLETYLAIIKSEYLSVFLEDYKEVLLENNGTKLKYILSIFAMTMKDFISKDLGKNPWDVVIEFIYNNKEAFKDVAIKEILEIVFLWNNSIFQGKTTRYCSIIALSFYNKIKQDYELHKFLKNDILTILKGSLEIKEELREILDIIIRGERTPFFKLVEHAMYNSIDGLILYKALPEEVLEILPLFWRKEPEKPNPLGIRGRWDTEEYYNLKSDYSTNLINPSAYSTPIYFLLKCSVINTFNFIVKFINESIEYFQDNKEYDNSMRRIDINIDVEYIKKVLEICSPKNKKEEIEVKKDLVNKDKRITVYHSSALWNMYRGNCSPAVPGLLKSIHMALEKYLLEVAETKDFNQLKLLLSILILNTKSSSLLAIVSSLVQAYPDELFEEAVILFRVKEFILEDFNRCCNEDFLRELYGMASPFNEVDIIFRKERLKTLEEKHRKENLSNTFLKLQHFCKGSKEEGERRKVILNKILDKYDLEMKQNKENNIKWETSLFKTDLRKLEVKVTPCSEGYRIEYIPRYPKDLQKRIDAFRSHFNFNREYHSLDLWSDFKLEGNSKVEDYPQFENDILYAFRLMNKLYEELNEKSNKKNIYLNLLNTTPLKVASVFIKTYRDSLTKEELKFCKDIVIEFAMSSNNKNYRPQIRDGVYQAISVLPDLIGLYPNKKNEILVILFKALYQEYCDRVGDIASSVLKNVWIKDYSLATSLYFGFIKSYSYLNIDLIFEKSDNEILKIINNEEARVPNLNLLYSYVLKKFIIELPEKIKGVEMSDYFEEFLKIIIKRLKNRDDSNITKLKYILSKKLSLILLNSSKDEIEKYLSLIEIDYLNYDIIKILLTDITLYSNESNSLWDIWDFLRDKIIENLKETNSSGIQKIIKIYMFAESEYGFLAYADYLDLSKKRLFFKRIIKEVGKYSCVFYSICKISNRKDIEFIDDIVSWISEIIRDGIEIKETELLKSIIYYLEITISKYISNNNLKEEIEKRKNVINILDFMIINKSQKAYKMKETL